MAKEEVINVIRNTALTLVPVHAQGLKATITIHTNLKSQSRLFYVHVASNPKRRDFTFQHLKHGQ